jgi:hypothetical protein
VCYTIGFGVARDTDRAKEILCERGLIDEELEHQVHLIRDAKMELGVQNRILQHLILQGHIRQIDYAQHYRENKLLHKAEKYYKREIQDIQELFTKTH